LKRAKTALYTAVSDRIHACLNPDEELGGNIVHAKSLIILSSSSLLHTQRAYAQGYIMRINGEHLCGVDHGSESSQRRKETARADHDEVQIR
jgi:hypothetical protein